MIEAAMRAGAVAALVLISLAGRPVFAQGPAAAAGDRKFVTSTPLPGGLPWNKDVAFGIGAADANTTGTLQLALGTNPGEYRVKNVDATVSLLFFFPDENRNAPLKLMNATGPNHGYEGEGVSLAGAVRDAASALFDFKVTGKREPLAMVEVKSDLAITTDTLQSCPSGMVLSKGPERVYFQFFGQRVFRSRTATGFRMVAPLKAATVARLSVSTTTKKPQEINALPITSAYPPGGPAAADPINANAKRPGVAKP